MLNRLIPSLLQSNEVLGHGRNLRRVVASPAAPGGEPRCQRHPVAHQLQVQRHRHRNGNEKEGETSPSKYANKFLYNNYRFLYRTKRLLTYVCIYFMFLSVSQVTELRSQ